MSIQLPDNACTGCGACINTCAAGAINMKEQTDGFMYPVIDTDKCVECGRCMEACHALSFDGFNKPYKCYAAQIKKQDILRVSTSGGLFFALASAVLSENGVVYACVYDESYNAYIERIDSEEGLAPVHGSKYVWSDSSRSYPRVKDDLHAGKTVLYTGLPCQTAGLKKYLGKPFDNLYAVDVLCGGAPSPYAFRRYLETLTDKEGLKSLNFQFRDKERFGSGVNCTYYINGNKHSEDYLENSFYFAFCSKSRISWRRSCYNCSYKSLQRPSDMTIGDYWGVENHHREFKPREGVSVVMINTAQGEKLFEKIKGSVDCVESKAEYATEKNSLVMTAEEGRKKMPADRDAFFAELRSSGWNTADKKYLGLRKKLLVKQKIGRAFKKLKGR